MASQQSPLVSDPGTTSGTPQGVKVICTRAVCAFGMSAAGTPTEANRSRRSSPGPARWPEPRGVGSPAATGKASALASCAGSTTTSCGANTTPLRCPTSSSTPGWPGRGHGSGCTSSPWPGCPNGCASSCSTGCNSAIRRHHRWIPPRCGSCSAASATSDRCAMPTHAWSVSPAGRSTTPRPGGCSATCDGIWTGPGHSTRARTRSPATCATALLDALLVVTDLAEYSSPPVPGHCRQCGVTRRAQARAALRQRGRSQAAGVVKAVHRDDPACEAGAVRR